MSGTLGSSVPWRMFLQALVLLVIAHALKHYFGIELQDLHL